MLISCEDHIIQPKEKKSFSLNYLLFLNKSRVPYTNIYYQEIQIYIHML